MQSPDNDQQQKIEKMIKALGIDLEFTGKEIAEILWLSLKRQELLQIEDEPKTQTRIHDEDDKNQTINQSLSADATPEIITSIPPREIPTQTTPIYADITDNTQQKGYSEQNLPLRIPDAPSIPKPLEFVKALHPLMQKVNSGRNTILDEIETVEQTAKNHGICVPILKSEPEPWLDLVLVVDEYKSMTLWQHTIRELKQLLKHYGIFREVKICGLSSFNREQLLMIREKNSSIKTEYNQDYEENQQNILLRTGVGKQQYFANPKELIDPTGRRLILIVSDCVAPFWHDGSILPILREWVKYQPLAIVQMLPDWMWRRTGLRIGSSVQFKNLVPGNSNQKLIIKELLLWKNMPLEQGIKVPVLTLEPQLAQAWSQMVVGKHDALAPGFVLPAEFQTKSENLPQNKVEQLNATKRVHRFRMNASPVARKLASLLSAAPMICLPVVRIIQASLLPQAQPVHIAEVFLGGLLKPTNDITPDTNSEQVEYQFVDEEIRQILFKDAPVSDSQQVFDAVSQYLQQHFGKCLRDFVALLKLPKNNGETIPSFAEIAFDILKQLGGDYAAFAAHLEQQSIPTTGKISEVEILETFETFKFEAEVATIVFVEEAKEKLQQWTFKTPTVNRRGETLKTTTHTASYFTETLTDNIGLEMVAIPGGMFTMGSNEVRSQKSEVRSDDYRDNERPQHDVTLQPFLMGKYPVTQAQWQAIAARDDLKVEIDLNSDPSRFKQLYQRINRWQRPVERVNWYEAVEFCQRLSQLTERDYRLPSEAQWEYACRAVTEPLNLETGESYPPFHFGETITAELANYRASSTYADEPKGEYREETTPVGQFPPNAFGLYDMHGNVWEWCADDWHDNYEDAPTDGSAWIDLHEEENVNDKNELYSAINNKNKPDFAKNEDNRLYSPLRGGSWLNLPVYCRSATRDLSRRRDDRFFDIGFRVVCGFGRTEGSQKSEVR